MEKKTAASKSKAPPGVSSYEEKIKTPFYRHVTKHTYGNKKYYYSVLPAAKFKTKSKGGDEVEITMKTGSKYIGQVNELNERNGFGRYYVIYGGMYEGYWRNGYKHGPGKFYNRHGALMYDGMWEAGEPHGEGKLYNEAGKLVYEGFMNKGKTRTGLSLVNL